jgi:hypothetical protein
MYTPQSIELDDDGDNQPAIGLLDSVSVNAFHIIALASPVAIEDELLGKERPSMLG